jgi:peroxiredoxin
MAPDFELADSTGMTRRLSDLASDGLLVLVFYRGWW